MLRYMCSIRAGLHLRGIEVYAAGELTTRDRGALQHPVKGGFAACYDP